MTLNYRQIPNALRNREPFKGNSMSAEASGESYMVFSYSTLIAVANGEEVAITDRNYSRTTSRHKNLCRAYL